MNWQKLKIRQKQLEETLNFDLISTWAIVLGRVFFFKQKQAFKSLLITEVCSLFFFCLLLVPIILILFRDSGWLSNNTGGFILVLIIATIISSFCLVVFNYYLWQKAKQLKVFIVLLDKVWQYNNLIQNLDLIAQLNTVTATNLSETSEFRELKTALHLTRDSLVKSIELEKIISGDRHLVTDRYQLLANLESGLINLSLVQTDANNYYQLYSEAIKIGLSVHRELSKNNSVSRF